MFPSHLQHRYCINKLRHLRYCINTKGDPMATISKINRAIPASLPPVSRVAFVMAQAVLRWETRRQTRRDLARLDPHLLNDIGLTPRLADCECRKPFWRD
jgi:uncharacterized protein YjiS (DUF1127 family)